MSRVRALLDELMVGSGVLGQLQALVDRDAPVEVRKVARAHLTRALIEVGEAFALVAAKADLETPAPGLAARSACKLCDGVGSVKAPRRDQHMIGTPMRWELCPRCKGSREERVGS